MRLCDGAHRADYLPLCHLVDRVDVIHAFDPVPVSLIHGIDAQVSRLPSWFRLAPLAMATCTARVLV